MKLSNNSNKIGVNNSLNNIILSNLRNNVTLKKNLNNPDDNNNKSIINYKELPNKTICFVYQYKYKNEKPVTGIGDFIRGIYFILQFSQKFNINTIININKHSIKNYLEYFINKPDLDDNISNNIPFLEIINAIYNKNNNIINYTYLDIDNQLLAIINKLSFYNNPIYLYLINHPNEKLISQIDKQKVQEILKPNTYITTLVNKAINNLNLTKHNFITIHIRTNDDCFSNKTSIYNKQLNYIIQNIKLIYEKYKLDIFILSSDNRIKKNIIQFIPYVKCIFNDIGHTCDIQLDNEKIEHTLKEFYIMSYSKYIYSFSVYDHGSGFSKWCAITFNIPYKCFFLNN